MLLDGDFAAITWKPSEWIFKIRKKMGFWRTEEMLKVAYVPFDMGSTQETINREMQSLWLVKMRFFCFWILFAPQESQEEGYSNWHNAPQESQDEMFSPQNISNKM